MELLALFVMVLVAWLIALPWRVVGTVRRHRRASAAVLVIVLIGGWFAVAALGHTVDTPKDYSAGDAALRAMLE